MDRNNLYYYIEAVHNYNLDPEKREIYLFPLESLASHSNDWEEPGIEPTISSRFIKNLNILSHLKKNSPITVHMKTGGGDWVEGMAIYDAIKNSPNYITIINYTHASSMSSVIFQSADWRVMQPNSHFMFHYGQYGGYGTVKTVRSDFDFYDQTGEVMLDIYSDRMSKKGKFSTWDKSKIKKMLKSEMDKKENVYLNPQETVEWGLADEIISV